jgi:hypothetical protein
MNKKYIVDLEERERRALNQITRSGKHSVRKIRWAHALLKADAGWNDEDIAEALDISLPTVQRIRQKFVEEGLEIALGARSQPGLICGWTASKRPIDCLVCGKAPERTLTLRLCEESELQILDQYLADGSPGLKKRFKTVAVKQWCVQANAIRLENGRCVECLYWSTMQHVLVCMIDNQTTDYGCVLHGTTPADRIDRDSIIAQQCQQPIHVLA